MKTATPLLRGWLSPNRYGIRTDAGETVSIGSAAPINFGTGSFSVEGWVLHDDYTYPKTFFPVQKQGATWNSTPGWGVSNGYIADKLEVFLHNGSVHTDGQIQLDAGYRPSESLGKLRHVGVVFNRVDGTVRAVVDGVLQSGSVTIPTTGSVSNSSSLVFGSSVGWQHDGLVAGLRLYSRALAFGELTQHYRGIFQDERGLAVWYPGVEGSGVTLNDASGNGLAATHNGAWEFFDPYPASMRRLTVADLYTFALRDGSFLRYTSLDADVAYGGNTFLCDAPVITRSRVTSRVGIEVAEMTLTVSPNTSDLINGVAWIPAVRGGALDGARVTVQRAFIWNPFVPPIGVVTVFAGRVSPITGGRSSVEIMVRSDTELFNMKIPRNLVQPGCLHTLFDTGCALSKAAFASNSSVDSGSTKAVINCGLPQTVGVFDLGTIAFISGPNNGLSRTVKRYTTGVFHLALPLPFTPGVGDTFSAHPGCDKQQTTCIDKFNNKINFRGLPYVPVPETAT